jgi:hypothetical protein
MGHNEDGGSNDNHKASRGLLSASLTGSDAPLTWRIQGEAGLDPVRGPLNNGGLFGERAGWSLPGFRDRDWQTVSLPDRAGPAGIAWYRTRFSLHLPRHQDVPVGLRFGDDPQRHYRVLIFVNSWNLGQYINDVGPQHVFVLPEGILRAHGTNTLALAVWSDDAASAGLGRRPRGAREHGQPYESGAVSRASSRLNRSGASRCGACATPSYHEA